MFRCTWRRNVHDQGHVFCRPRPTNFAIKLPTRQGRLYREARGRTPVKSLAISSLPPPTTAPSKAHDSVTARTWCMRIHVRCLRILCVFPDLYYLYYFPIVRLWTIFSKRKHDLTDNGWCFFFKFMFCVLSLHLDGFTVYTVWDYFVSLLHVHSS